MPTNSLKTAKSVLWIRVSGLAALHGAITITWIVYNLYLPELLARYGFPLAVAQLILVVENLLAAAVEPAMGALSDRASRRQNGRVSFIARGGLLSAAAFIAIPLVALVWVPAGIARWILPLFLVLWALLMATIRSPSLSLLKKSASDQNLPRAAALITVITGLFAAIRPFSTDTILSMGPVVAFAIGSGGLLLGTFVLGRLYANDEADATATADPEVGTTPDALSERETHGSGLKPYILTMGLIFGVGIGGAWSFRFATGTVSKLLATQFPEVTTSWLMSGFFFLLACAALPLGVVASKYGNQKVMMLGTGAAALGVGLFGLWSIPVLWPLVIVLVLVGLSVVTTGAAPFALSIMPEGSGGLGVGLYFGGFTFATSIFNAWFGPLLAAASLPLAALWAAGSFLVSCVFLAASLTMLPTSKAEFNPQTESASA